MMLQLPNKPVLKLFPPEICPDSGRLGVCMETCRLCLLLHYTTIDSMGMGQKTVSVQNSNPAETVVIGSYNAKTRRFERA